MQTLTSPANITKRKQACRSCRQRKKRCDGDRPSCLRCREWGIKCEYTVPASNKIDAHVSSLQFPGTLYNAQPTLPINFEQEDSLDFLQFPGMNFDFSTDTSSTIFQLPNEYPSPDSGPDASLNTHGTDIDAVLNPEGILPSDQALLELVNLFFEHHYTVFPCFHKATFLDQVHRRALQTEAPSLLYAICSIASRQHHDLSIQSRRTEWYELAKFEYDMTPRDPQPGLRALQTAMLVCYHGCTRGDFSSGWLTIGKAWRQCCALGLNRIDSDHEMFYGLSHPVPQTTVEREEYRRTLWVLFMLDRNHSWPTGWPNAIDERQFMVNIPVAEELFQAMTSETTDEDIETIPFARNLDKLISASSAAAKSLNTFHYLCVAHVLLGRVAEQIHSLHDSPHTPEYTEECNELDSSVIKFRLSLPRPATSIFESPVEAQPYVVRLNVMLNTMAMLLHYRCARFVDETAAQEQFTKAAIAARNTAHIVKDASRISIDLLLSAHIGSSLYVAACVLVMHWRITGDNSLKADIDLFALVFERFTEAFGFLGLKLKLALEHDLERSKESILDLRERGFRGLLADCSKWQFVKDKALAMGMVVR